jgi:hypothetical protein
MTDRLSEEELREVEKVLGSNWYDRSEDDDAIIAEMTSEFPPAYGRSGLELLRRFLADPRSHEDKAALIRRAAWRWFPPTEPDAPLAWLHEVVAKLERALAERQ